MLVLHLYALEHFLFWKYWWMDIVLHVLGGIIIGGTSLYISQYGIFKPLSRRPFLVAIPFAATVVVGWEIFERAAGVFQESEYVFDTASDITFGFGTALLVVVLLWRRIPPTTPQ
jgi:hypothetical protein